MDGGRAFEAWSALRSSPAPRAQNTTSSLTQGRVPRQQPEPSQAWSVPSGLPWMFAHVRVVHVSPDVPAANVPSPLQARAKPRAIASPSAGSPYEYPAAQFTTQRSPVLVPSTQDA